MATARVCTTKRPVWSGPAPLLSTRYLPADDLHRCINQRRHDLVRMRHVDTVHQIVSTASRSFQAAAAYLDNATPLSDGRVTAPIHGHAGSPGVV